MIIIPQRKNYRIPLFCVVTFLYWASLYTYTPILTAYIESLGATHKMAGIIVGSYGLVQMLLRIPIGIISDKTRKHKLFISIGLSFSLFSVLGLLAFKDITLVLISRSAAGIAAATWVDFTVLFSSYFKHEEASQAMGKISFYNAMGQTTAMLTGSYAADVFGWEAPFILGAVIAAAGIILSFFIIDRADADIPKQRGKFTEVATDKTLITVSFYGNIRSLHGSHRM